MAGTIIVIGAGASKGVGGALARRFSSEGHNVIIGGRTVEKVETLAAEINAVGGSAEGFRIDVTSETDQDALFAHAAAQGEIAGVLRRAQWRNRRAWRVMRQARFFMYL